MRRLYRKRSLFRWFNHAVVRHHRSDDRSITVEPLAIHWNPPLPLVPADEPGSGQSPFEPRPTSCRRARRWAKQPMRDGRRSSPFGREGQTDWVPQELVSARSPHRDREPESAAVADRSVGSAAEIDYRLPFSRNSMHHSGRPAGNSAHRESAGYSALRWVPRSAAGQPLRHPFPVTESCQATTEAASASQAASLAEAMMA